MKPLTFAGLAGFASLAAQAQIAPPIAVQPSAEPLIVTATRAIQPGPTLRDAIVISREELEEAGALSLGEILQRKAGIELRSTGGAGQPQSLFVRGSGSAQTLVLVDGLRVGSATVGTTAIEHIPLEMIERIEVVKGPLSSLYGGDAIGGVIQIFTRGKDVPHLFGSVAYGSENDRRASAGLGTVDGDQRASISAGWRKVDAASSTNPRAGFLYNPDRDPYENGFANVRVAQKLWQGETIEIAAFGSRSRTHFDSGPTTDDYTDQTVAGAKVTSSNQFLPWWASKLTLGQGRDRLVTRGSFPSTFETRQDQGAWLNQFTMPSGKLVLGGETLRQRVLSDTAFTRTTRNTNSGFASVDESWQGQRFEASIRRDEDEQFGTRNTGSASLGYDWPGLGRLAGTYGRGFRAPTFFDLYGPTSAFFTANPALRPERSRSYELSLKSDPSASLQWRVTGFDNRLEDLIVYSFTQLTVLNVARARVRGGEVACEAVLLGARIRGALTVQQPRDEDTGKRLQGRARQFGTFEASRAFGSFTAGLSVTATGARFDSTTESSASRLPGYALLDARLRYSIDKRWSVEVSASNLTDRRYENAVGYDAPRRSVLLNVRFEAF